MIYEVINPSDPYTLESDDFLTACLVACLLGGGAYGLDAADHSRSMPIFLFGGEEEWFIEQFGRTFAELLHTTEPAALAAVLDTVWCCSVSERAAIARAVEFIETEEAQAAYIAAVNEERRSSLNNVAARARGWAAKLREKEAA